MIFRRDPTSFGIRMDKHQFKHDSGDILCLLRRVVSSVKASSQTLPDINGDILWLLRRVVSSVKALSQTLPDINGDILCLLRRVVSSVKASSQTLPDINNSFLWDSEFISKYINQAFVGEA
ncbi:uncharacterized protein [Cicer arietinum]|uniref:uncharacterized protein isoform X2 n=1 Tax=Cicer arietinum TaxID=3827 RepID=UPI003CC5F4AF